MPIDERSILIFEPHAGSLKRTVSLVEQCGYVGLAASTTEQAAASAEEDGIIALLIAHTPAGVELGQYVREFTSVPGPLIAIVGQSETNTEAVMAEMGADGFLRRPFSAGALEGVMSTGHQIAVMRQRISALDGSVAELEGRLQRSGLTSPRTGFHHFDAVKDLLVVEVRRAKRYGYPLATLMVGLDPIADPLGESREPALSNEITAGLAVAIAKSIRVIDLPIHFADDRILVFLPHTDLLGAEEVGRRIKRRIRKITYRGQGKTMPLTASVGVAGIGAGETLTFSKLIKNSAAALKAAQLRGGDKLMMRAPRTEGIVAG